MNVAPERLRKLHGLPVVGPWLVSTAVASVAPYFASIAPRIAVLEPGRCDVQFRNRRQVRNHLGTVHAIAMCNAGGFTQWTVALVSHLPGLRLAHPAVLDRVRWRRP